MRKVVVAVIIVHDHSVFRRHFLLDHEEKLSLVSMLEFDLVIVLVEDMLHLLIERTLFGKVFVDDLLGSFHYRIFAFGQSDKRSLGKVDPDLGRYISCLLWF